MLKRLIPQPMAEPPATERWLDLSSITVEVTSESSDHPVERALLDDTDGQEGWRAGGSGVQTIRLLFAEPTEVKAISILFVEAAVERTQEFAIRWSDGTGDLKEIIRQRWNFSPNGSTSEREDYHAHLPGLRVLELTVTPDLGGADAYASVRRLRLA